MKSTITKQLQKQFSSIDPERLHSLSAEAGCLGSMLLDNSCIASILLLLPQPDAFFEERHRIIYEALLKLHFKNIPIDGVILRNELEWQGTLKKVGGVEYIAKILQSVPSAANAEYYAGEVKKGKAYRDLVNAVDDIIEVPKTRGLSLDEMVEQIRETALNLETVEVKQDIYQVKEVTQSAFEGLIEEKPGLSTGFPKIDWHLGGLCPGSLYVVAARPSMGKTAWALDVSLNVARAGKSVVIYSLEMTKKKLTQRMICSMARVNSHKVRQQQYSPEDVTELGKAGTKLNDYKIFIMDYSELTPEGFKASLMVAKRKHGADCVIIDYLQLMHTRGKSENRQQEISTISRKLKAVAKSEELPVILLSQLNREVEHRMNHKPQLSDLRESGSIEQDADVVILMHRPDWYHKSEEGYIETNNGVFQIAKSRNGPTGELELQFNAKYVSFGNITED